MRRALGGVGGVFAPNSPRDGGLPRELGGPGSNSEPSQHTTQEGQLTSDVVRRIRRMREQGATVTEIASAIGHRPGTVAEVIRGRAWRHVT